MLEAEHNWIFSIKFDTPLYVQVVMYYGHNNNYVVLYYAVVACVYNSIHSCISTTNQLIPIYIMGSR